MDSPTGFFGQLIAKIRSGGKVLEFDPSPWDDIKFPANGAKLDSPASDIEYNSVDLGYDFETTARYPTDFISYIGQLSHSKKMGTILDPHIHWIQNQDKIPNWLLAYRWYKNGEAPPAFTLAPINGSIFTYVSGSMLQISEFPDIDPPTDETASSFLDLKLYRDVTNVSTLFAGADDYVGDALLKEFDCHFQKDTLGSFNQYVK